MSIGQTPTWISSVQCFPQNIALSFTVWDFQTIGSWACPGLQGHVRQAVAQQMGPGK